MTIAFAFLDEDQLLRGLGEEDPEIISAKDGRLLGRLDHAGVVTAIEVSPARSFIATISSDGVVRLWGSHGHQIAALRGHAPGDIHVEFSADEKRVLTLDGKAARVWAAHDGAPIFTVEQPPGLATVLSADGAHILALDADRTRARVSLDEISGEFADLIRIACDALAKTVERDGDETLQLARRTCSAH